MTKTDLWQQTHIQKQPTAAYPQPKPIHEGKLMTKPTHGNKPMTKPTHGSKPMSKNNPQQQNPAIMSHLHRFCRHQLETRESQSE